ncbi:alginate lyase family protein [Alteromonas oceanisediminis]|uniref:alginate lyase family protein n=1 Tax=Alteromonas oceanisediminis TaxID=2836180 RepID=UPI001BD99CA6|nr:alginate lyase family protein [Alteromonas oceanisediminis]MBT0585620.1 alginate lyase family protein [Alteromonas oceanisediminis]
MTSCATRAPRNQINLPFEPISVSRSNSTDFGNCQYFSPFTDDLNVPSKYSQSERSKDTINNESHARYREATESIYAYTTYMVSLVDDISSDLTSTQSIRCYSENLLQWADRGALSTTLTSKTGKAVRKWALASLAASYVRLNLSNQLTQKQQLAIQNWLVQLAELVISDYSDRAERLRNNHDYWAAWAVMNVAAISHNTSMYNWAKKVWLLAMSDVQSTGLLHNEMKRGKRAREYQNFATMPLVGLAAFIAANEDSSDMSVEWQSYYRLVSTTVKTITDSSGIEELAGKQNSYKPLQGGRIAWVPIHLSFANGSSPAVLCSMSELVASRYTQGYSRLGGKTGTYYAWRKACKSDVVY